MTVVWSPDSEVEVIGASMYAPDQCEDAFERLTAAHFHDPVHSRVWAAMRALRAAGSPIAPALVRDALGKDEGFQSWGGVEALGQLYDRASVLALPGHVQAIEDRFIRRSVMDLARHISERAENTADGTGETLLSELERGAADIAKCGVGSDAWVSAGEVIRRAVAAARERKGAIEFCSGLTDVDRLVGGFGRGELSIIAGRPGMAKSIAASQIAKANGAQGRGTAFFSKEMSEEQLGLRLACDVAFDPSLPVFSADPTAGNPTFDAARKNLLSPEQWERLGEAAAITSQWPIMFDTRPGLTMSTIESCSRRILRVWERAGVEPGPIIVDHLGIIRPETNRSGNKVAETSDISRGLAEMAKRLDVPVIALCQLSREVEKRGEDKRPGLSDLRWSGELEQDARLVMFLYRPEYYFRPPLDPNEEEAHERAEREAKLRKVQNRLIWIVAKNNNGPLGQVETFCDVSRAVIRDRRS